MACGTHRKRAERQHDGGRNLISLNGVRLRHHGSGWQRTSLDPNKKGRVQPTDCVSGQRGRTPCLFFKTLNPTRPATWLLGGLCALAAAGCTRDQASPAPEPVAVRYAQTQCADPWGQAPDPQQLVAVAQAYLAQQGLALHQPRARVANAGAICNACHCPTGLVLEGTVPPADAATMLALGFTKQ